MRTSCVLALLLVSLIGVHSSSVLLVDNSQGSYLKTSQELVKVNRRSLSSLISALSGLLPPSDVDAETSTTLDQVINPSPLKKPRAHVVFNVAGLTPDMLGGVFGDKQFRVLELQEQDPPAFMVVDSLASIAYSNPEVSIAMLDDQGLQGCVGNCIDEHMDATAGCMGATIGDMGLMFPSGASLDFNNLADKMFGVETASLYSGLQAQLQQGVEQEQDMRMLETTLVSLHGLETSYGSESEVVTAARQALLNLLKWTVKHLDEKYGDDVTYQASGFSGVPQKTTVQDIMGWKQDARRRLLSGTTITTTSTNSSTQYPPADEVAAAKTFTAKACAYGGFILLLYFSLAAVWCMCYMPMKQDTMLFGAKKTE